MGRYVPTSPSLMRLRNQEHVYPFPIALGHYCVIRAARQIARLPPFQHCRCRALSSSNSQLGAFWADMLQSVSTWHRGEIPGVPTCSTTSWS